MLKPDVQLCIEWFLKTVAAAERSLLLLDYDGTLAPFREKRDQAFPYPGVAEVLQEIVGSGRTRVVIVSGRDANETIPLLGIEPIPEVWGLHGLQRRRVDGGIETVRIDECDLAALSAAEGWVDDQCLRQSAEFKIGSIAVHWRGESDSEIERMRSRLLVGWKSIADHTRLELLEFDGGVEIRAPGIDKGDVVRVVLREVGEDTPAAYLGDDNTDESAFGAINGRGLSVLVRPRLRRTAAQLWLRPPGEMLEFLRQWSAAVHLGNAKGGQPVSAVTGL